MKVTLEFENSHHYIKEYLQCSDAKFCPQCGVEGLLWTENSEGDYYLGPSTICTNCAHSFTIQGPSRVSGAYENVLYQLRSGKQTQPTTKLGR